MNRRGSILWDGLVAGSFVLMLAFAFILIGAILTPINNAFQAADVDASGKAVVNDFNSSTPGIFDWILANLFIGLPLVSLGLAYINRIPNIFFFVMIAITFMFGAVGMVVSVMWDSVTDNILLGDAAANMPITDFIMGNYGIYFLVSIALIGIGTYVRTRSSYL